MLEKVDTNYLQNTLKFFSLKEYPIDGTLSYCDISSVESLVAQTKSAIEKTIVARSKNNWRVLNKIAQYTDSEYVISSAVGFYTLRNLFSYVKFFISEAKSQQVYYLEDISIIPKGIRYDDSALMTKQENIHLFYSTDNADVDMYIDKMFLTFFKYFHIAQIPINDFEVLMYTSNMHSKICSPRDRSVYDLIRNISFLVSTFIVYDRLSQFKQALKYADRERKLWLSKTQKINSLSWVVPPRKDNIEYITKLLDDSVLEADYHRLLLLIKRHLSYFETVKGLDPYVIITEQIPGTEGG